MMAALGRPQPLWLQTSRPQVGLGPLVSKDGGRKAESQRFISLLFLHLNFGRSIPPHFRRIVFACFLLFVSLFVALFACFSHFCRFFFAFHSRHPQILVSQMLPGQVPRVCLSRPAASPRHPVRNPAPAPRPPKPFPTCPVPAPAAQPKSRACKQLSFRAFVFQRLSQLT